MMNWAIENCKLKIENRKIPEDPLRLSQICDFQFSICNFQSPATYRTICILSYSSATTGQALGAH